MGAVSLRMADMQRWEIPIGYVNENLRTQVRIDCKKMFDEYPNAVVSLAVLPPKGDAYPDVVTRDGDWIVWNILAHDVQYGFESKGAFQLTFTSGEIVAKSPVGRFKVTESIVPNADAPDPIADWISEANIILGEIPVTIAESVDNALTVAKESGEFDGKDGADGQDGFSPIVQITDIAGGHRVTITDSSGAHTYDVLDGADGQDGKDGKDGADGTDGFSPTVAVTDITGGHRVTITDAQGSHVFDVLNGQNGSNGVVQDVQDNGTSLLDANGVATIPRATTGNGKWGLLKIGNGLYGDTTNGVMIERALPNQIKAGQSSYFPIVPAYQETSVFYGLAKLAGADMANSSNAVGVFTDDAKLKIQQMIGLWTPKFSMSATCQEEDANFGQTELVCDDIAINIGEELVVIIYQTNSANGDAIGGNNWGDFLVKDAVNNTYFANGGYLMGSKPLMIRFKRFPYVLTSELSWVNAIANTSPLRVYPRTLDYVDKIRWLRLHFEGSVVKVGTRIDAYVGRFI